VGQAFSLNSHEGCRTIGCMPPLVVQSTLRHGHQRVVLTDTKFGIAGHVMWPRSDVGRVVSATFANTTFVQHMFVLDQDDRLLVRMSGDVYPPEKMNQLVDALEVPVTDFPDVVVRKQPGHVPQLRPLLSDEPGFATMEEFDEAHPGLLSEQDFLGYGEGRGLTIYYIVVAVLAVVAIMALAAVALITTDW
jgi:hypothetical protein